MIFKDTFLQSDAIKYVYFVKELSEDQMKYSFGEFRSRAIIGFGTGHTEVLCNETEYNDLINKLESESK